MRQDSFDLFQDLPNGVRKCNLSNSNLTPANIFYFKNILSVITKTKTFVKTFFGSVLEVCTGYGQPAANIAYSIKQSQLNNITIKTR